MADDHTLFQVQSPNREVIALAGNFTAGGTGVITALVGRGISAATRVSTGVYLVTLASNYPAFGYVDAHPVAITTAQNVVLQCSPPSGKSMTISSYATTTAGNSGAATDITVGYQVHFRIDAFNSSVK